MTDEQIKQNAANYYEHIINDDAQYRFACNCFVAGAHSRDKEVNDLEKALANVNELCHQQRNKIYELRHPWISVEKRVPKFVEENNYNKLSDTKFVRVRNNQTGETRIDTAEYFQSKETKRCWWSIHELWWDETVTDWMDAPK